MDVPSSDYKAFKKPHNLKYSYKVGLLDRDRDRHDRIFHETRGAADHSYDQKLGRLINYKELHSHSYSLLHNQKLSIVLQLDLLEKSSEIKPQMSALQQQYEKLFNNEKFSDFIFVSSSQQEIPVHKMILSTRSPVFETMMETNMRESQEKKATIDDIDAKSLFEFLRFVYCGRVEGIEEVAIDLLYAASKYDVPDLKPICAIALFQKLTNANVIETMMLAELHHETELLDFCIDYVKWNYDDLKDSEVWKDVSQSLYKKILDTILLKANDSETIVISSDIKPKPATVPGVAINVVAHS
jgi:hypothetical protein